MVQFSSTMISPLLQMGKPRHKGVVSNWSEVILSESGRGGRIQPQQSEARAYTLKHVRTLIQIYTH